MKKIAFTLALLLVTLAGMSAERAGKLPINEGKVYKKLEKSKKSNEPIKKVYKFRKVNFKTPMYACGTGYAVCSTMIIEYTSCNTFNADTQWEAQLYADANAQSWVNSHVKCDPLIPE